MLCLIFTRISPQPPLEKVKEKAEEEYWFRLRKKGLYDDMIDLGKGTVRRACKYRGLKQKATENIIDHWFKPLMHKTLRIYGLDGCVAFGGKRSYYDNRDDVAIALVDHSIKKHYHFSNISKET
jgi:hypothetical protein